MSSDNLINYSYSLKDITQYKNIEKKVVLEVKTPLGKVKIIKNQKELLTFIFEEKIQVHHTQKKDFSFKHIKELDQSIENINQLYNKHFPLEKQKGIKQINSQKPIVEERPSAYLQVLAGNNSFYIGVCTSETIVKEGLREFLKNSNIEKEQIQFPTEPHITIIPPSKKITPSLALNKIINIQPFELEFDRVSISKKGNINLWGKESDHNYHELSESIAGALDSEQNSRAPHTKIGVLSKDFVDQIFADPKKFGFEKDENDPTRLFKKLNTPLKQHIAASTKDYSDEQILLKIQFEGATPLSNEEIAKSKESFNRRIKEVKQKQEEIQTLTYHTRKSNFRNIPFNWKKLVLAIEGDQKLGKVPLTFSCRENGILLWREFCKDVKAVIESSKYDDITVQMLGSGVHGFSRNPKKEIKGWDYGSDGDFAIFSKKMALDCAKQGVQVNEGVQMNGKFTVFKNERSNLKEGIGFYDTQIGQKFQKLQEKWSVKLYGTNRALGVDIDFKLNINSTPFKDAITIT